MPPRSAPKAWSPGIAVLGVVAVLFFPSLFIFQQTGWGGASGTPSSAAACPAVRSSGGRDRQGDVSYVPPDASLKVVVASASPDTAWVQYAVDAIRARSASASVLVYRMDGGSTGSAGNGSGSGSDWDASSSSSGGRRRSLGAAKPAPGGGGAPPGKARGGKAKARHKSFLTALIRDAGDGEAAWAPTAVEQRSVPGEGKGEEALAYLTAIVEEYERLPDVVAFLRGYSGRHSRVPNTWVLQHLLQQPPARLPRGYLGAQCRPVRRRRWGACRVQGAAGGAPRRRVRPVSPGSTPADADPASHCICIASKPTCLPACLPTCLPTCLPAAQPGGEFSFRVLPTNLSANSPWAQPAARFLAQAGATLAPLPPPCMPVALPTPARPRQRPCAAAAHPPLPSCLACCARRRGRSFSGRTWARCRPWCRAPAAPSSYPFSPLRLAAVSSRQSRP